MINKKKILLVGMGSEIGSCLLLLNDPNKDLFLISTVLTNKIDGNNTLENLKALQARLILNDPSFINLIKIDEKYSCLIINRKKIKIFWGDIKNFDLKKIKQNFEATIIATSKIHINNKKIMSRYLKISKYVFGVAESKKIPSLYPSLLNINTSIIPSKAIKLQNSTNKIFALGSCQSNGWQAQLRGILEFFKNKDLEEFKMIGTELDIVHPDTPQGKLGTKGHMPREQDARNNLRPGFSQVNISMKKLFPKIHTLNTISLRTLITPPGYQICRFYFRYKFKNNKRTSLKNLINSLKETSKNYPNIIKISENTLGSRAYERTESAAVILADEKYIHFKDDLFMDRLNKEQQTQTSQIIVQSYVHNTRGYCRSVLDALKAVVKNKKNHKKLYYWI